MGGSLRTLMRRVGGVLPSVRAERRVARLQDSVKRIDHLIVGSNATYIGDNRVLVRMIAGVHAFLVYVHADDKLISPWIIANGTYEPDVTQYFMNNLQSDSHCIDVGANLGYFTILMAKYCHNGHVVALEPNPPVHGLAADNILLNALHEQTTLLNAAVSDKAGEITLFHRIGRSGNTSIAPCGEDFTDKMREPPERPFTIPAVTIDDLQDRLAGRVDFIKIDVEGAEPLAFAGAQRTIATNPRLNILMEWAPFQIQSAGFDMPDFVRSLAAAGLKPHLISSGLQQISHDELISLPYQSGILLKRA